MTESELIKGACDTIEGYLAVGNERFEACGATFIRNRATPTRYDANTIGLIRDAAKIDALVARADVEYAHLDFRQYHIDPPTPPEVEASLALAGYARWSATLVMVLEGDIRASPKSFDIREVLNEEDWADYDMLDNLWWKEGQNTSWTAEVMRDLSKQKRFKWAAGVRYWLAHDGNEAAAFPSWPGENGVGQIEDLFTHPQHRHRGLATALIAHCVTDARSRGAGPVVIIADPPETPAQMYAALGFRPLLLARSQYR